MSERILVFGIGGTGKGVLNWIKKYQKDPLLNAIKRNIVLCGFDGDTNDQFILDDGTCIDLGGSSPEFYQLTQSGAGVKNDIAAEKKANPLYSEWFLRSEALRITDTLMTPVKGFAQNRFASKTCLIMESNKVKEKINQRLQEFLSNYDTVENKNIFLIGSTAGGAGSGMFIEFSKYIRTLLKDQYPGDLAQIIFQGIIVLPNCFNSVINAPNDVKSRDARSVAFLREIHRHMNPNKGTNDVPVFDVCYLLDGSNPKSDLTKAIHPRDGISQSIARFIIMNALDTNSPSEGGASPIASSQRNAMGDNSNAPEDCRYSCLGLSSIFFAENDLLNQYKFDFAKDLIKKLTTVPDDNVTGIEKAKNVMKKFSFLKFVNQVTDNVTSNKDEIKTLNIYPPDNPEQNIEKLKNLISTMKNILNCGKTKLDFPASKGHDFLDLPTEITLIKAYLFALFTNDALIAECKQKTNLYIGTQNSYNRKTLYGWINLQIHDYTQVVYKELYDSIIEVFYNHTKAGYEAKTLEKDPYLLVIGHDFLKTIKDRLEVFRNKISEIIKDFNKTGYGPIKDVESQIEALSKGYHRFDKNIAFQNRYLELYQVLVYLKIWQIFVESIELLSTKLEKVVNGLWDTFGNPSKGWIKIFQELIKEFSDNASKKKSIRNNMDSNPNLLVLPRVGQDSDIMMYNQDLDAHQKDILKDMRWAFYGPSQVDELEASPGELYISLPDEYFNAMKAKKVLKRDILDGKIETLQVQNLEKDVFVKMGEDKFKPTLSKKTIWDLLELDYTYFWKNKQTSDAKSTDLDTYNEEIIDFLFSHSAELLSKNKKSTEESKTNLYVAADFVSTKDDKDNSISYQISTAFFKKFDKKSLREHPNFSKMLFCTTISHQINWLNWSYFDSALENYANYISTYYDQDILTKGSADTIINEEKVLLPIHLETNEKNASLYEIYSLQKRIDREYRLFTLSTVKALKDIQFLKQFCHVFLRNMIKTKPSDVKDPMSKKNFYIDTTINHVDQEIILGPIDDIYAVIYSAMKDKQVIQSVSDLYIKAFTKIDDKTLKQNSNLIKNLNCELGDNVKIPEDLQRLFKIILYDMNEQISKVVSP